MINIVLADIYQLTEFGGLMNCVQKIYSQRHCSLIYVLMLKMTSKWDNYKYQKLKHYGKGTYIAHEMKIFVTYASNAIF